MPVAPHQIWILALGVLLALEGCAPFSKPDPERPTETALLLVTNNQRSWTVLGTFASTRTSFFLLDGQQIPVSVPQKLSIDVKPGTHSVGVRCQGHWAGHPVEQEQIYELSVRAGEIYRFSTTLVGGVCRFDYSLN